ncbi:hypothetical protein C8F01DRAFT_971137, partial [Mycena amicta]
KLKRWARVRLPNKQIARSQFGEMRISRRNIRMSHMVKVDKGDTTFTDIVEVNCFFVANDKAFGIGYAFQPPDQTLLKRSYGTVWASFGPGTIIVFEVFQILSVVGMVPWTYDGKDGWFLVEKPGLEMVTMSGYEEEDTQKDAEDDDEE